MALGSGHQEFLEALQAEDVPFGGTEPVDLPLTKAELYGCTEDQFWKLVKFVAEREPERVEHYEALERIEKRRREIRKEIRRAQLRQRPQPSNQLTLQEALSVLEGVRPRGKKWVAKCPVHEDKIASLVVFEHSDKPDVPTFHCSAGCAFTDIRAALKERL